MGLSPQERRVLELVDARKSEDLEFLRELVAHNSFTSNVEGVNRVGEILEERLEKLGFRSSVVVTGVTGRSIVARRPADGSHRLLLIGHLDTVHSPESSFRELSEDPEHPDRLLGPGAADMKGGLVVMLSALEALHAAGELDGRHVTVVLCADEETGSQTSGDVVRGEAMDSQLALTFEPGRPAAGEATTFVTGRKGCGRFTVEARGKAAHTGNDPTAGASAILELASKVIAMEELNDPERGVSVCVGTIEGGTAANVVPAFARMEVDFRFVNEDDGALLEDELSTLAQSHHLESESGRPLVGKTITNRLMRPAMERGEATARMAGRIVEWGKELGIELVEESRGGSSDAALAAEVGCPAVCGLGVVGDRFHSPAEWVSKESLSQRARLAALVMRRFFDL